MAEARRNRTNPSTLPRRNNGFEDRGSHQTPFASIGGSADNNTTRASRMPCQREACEPSPRSTRTLPEKYTNPPREVHEPSPRSTRTLPEKYTNPPREVHEPSPRRVRTFPEKSANLPR